MKSTNIFESVARKMIGLFHIRRTILYVLGTFFFDMIVANDMSLITFLPLTYIVLHSTKNDKYLAFTFIIQTIAANMGGMITPYVNPQNLYLYSYYNIGRVEFINILLNQSIYVNKAKISQMSKSNRKAKKIKYFMEEKYRFYGIIEVVITMIELLASAYAAEEFVNRLALFITTIGISIELAILFSIIIVTVVLSYVLLVFGGILPKQIARNYPEKTVYKIINILWIVSILNSPFNWLVKTTTKMFSRLFRIQENPKDVLTEKEIKMIIAEGKNQGVIDSIEKQIVLGALKFDNIIVNDIMVKKEDVKAINIADGKEKILKNISKYNYTRIPVYKENSDNIIGIYNIKDIIIEYSKTNKINIDIEKQLRDVLFVHKSEPIEKAFKSMQKKNLSIAVVIDDNQKMIGIITMEDIIETLVGKIFDEFDVKDVKK